MFNRITLTEPDEFMLKELQERSIQYDTNCHRVGRIVAFNKNELTCDVQLLELMDNVTTGSQNFAIIKQLPLIIEGNDNSHLTWGNIVGSECLIHFNDRDIDNWFKTGEEYLPNTTRMHNFSDGFVTLRPRSKGKIFAYFENGVEIKNGNTVIHLNDDGTVEITNGTSTITMNGGTVAITGNVTVSGDITATGTITGDTDVVAGTISGKGHVHTGNLGTDTSTPH